jgi:hypothetical protein
MLAETTEYLALLRRDTRPSENLYVSVLARHILRHGSQADAVLALGHFLNRPDVGALQIVQRHGTFDMGRQLFETFVTDQGLRGDCPDDVLQAIGYLGYEPAAPELFLYAREASHHAARAACLGLLDLTCEAVRKDIERMILDLQLKTQFPEFLPSIAVKSRNPALMQVLPFLAERTSIDNIAGILLGLAAYGPPAITHFKRFLNEPKWEAYSAPTATGYHLAMGFRALDLKASDLFDEILAEVRDGIDDNTLRYRLACLIEVLPSADAEILAPRCFQKSPPESIAHAYDKLFGSSTNDSPDLEDLVARLPEPANAYERFPNMNLISERLANDVIRQFEDELRRRNA